MSTYTRWPILIYNPKYISSTKLYLRKNVLYKDWPGPRGTFDYTINFDSEVNFLFQMEVRPFS